MATPASPHETAKSRLGDIGAGRWCRKLTIPKKASRARLPACRARRWRSEETRRSPDDRRLPRAAAAAVARAGTRRIHKALDAGEIGPFELDELIHHYKCSAQKLWSFCGQTGSQWLYAARTVEYWREHGEPEPD